MSVDLVKRGLFVGRFQPFHNGHLYAIDVCCSKVEELVIVIGSAQQSHEINNPFTAGERLEMVALALRGAGKDMNSFYIVPIPDVVNHQTWVAHVKTYVPRFNVVFSNEPLTRRLFIEEKYKVEGIPLFQRDKFWATEVRDRMCKGRKWDRLVPPRVTSFIKSIDGVERIMELAKKDLPPRST